MSLEINLTDMSDELIENYTKRLIAQIWKSLPMREVGDATLEKHLESTLREIVGNKEMITDLKNDALFLSLIGTIGGMISNLKEYRADVFKCIDIIKKLKEKYCD